MAKHVENDPVDESGMQNLNGKISLYAKTLYQYDTGCQNTDSEGSSTLYQWDSSDDENVYATPHVKVIIPGTVTTNKIDHLLAIEPWADVNSTQASSDGSSMSDGESVSGYHYAGDITKLDDETSSLGGKSFNGESFPGNHNAGDETKLDEATIDNTAGVCTNNENSEPKIADDKLQESGDSDTADTGNGGKQSENKQQDNNQQKPEQSSNNGNKNLESVNNQQQGDPDETPSRPPDGLKEMDEVEIYRKTLIDIIRIRLMFVGHYKAGKTCLGDSLLNKPFRVTDRTQGIDVTTCSVDITSSENWEKVPDDFQKFYEEVEALKAKILLPDCDTGYESSEIRTSDHPEIKIWDMEGEFGYYCSHQMFLDSQCIYLLVMDASKDVTKMLDAEIPLLHANDHTENIHCPRKMFEFLDYWLDNISTFISTESAQREESGIQSGNTEDLPSIAIVLTHTDKLGPDTEKIISEYREKIETHIENKYAARFVHPHIFAVSNKERCEKTLHELNMLKETIIKMAAEKDELSKNSTIPFMWMLIEAGIRKYSQTTNKHWFLLSEIESKVLEKERLPLKECIEFLRFQHNIRRMFFVEMKYETCHDEFDALVITNPQYVIDVYRPVIALWHGLIKDSTAKTFYRKHELKHNINDRTVSLRHLRQVWSKFLGNNISVAHLAWMLSELNQIFMCDGYSWEDALIRQNLEIKFTIPVLLPPSPREVPDASTAFFKIPLIYYFYLAHDVVISTFRNSTAFLPPWFLPLLASRLGKCDLDGQCWTQTKLYFDSAEFTTGKDHGFFLTLSTHRNSIFVNVFQATNDANLFCAGGCVLNHIRNQIEKCICHLMDEMWPQLKCSVCVSPCYTWEKTICPSHNADIHNHEIHTGCLRIIQPVQSKKSDKQVPLKIPFCRDHKLGLPIKSYSCWFCSGETHANPDKILWRITKYVPDESTLRDLCYELDIPCVEIRQCLSDKHGQINLVTDCLLRGWLDKQIGGFSYGSGAWDQLQNALEKAKLPSLKQILAEL